MPQEGDRVIFPDVGTFEDPATGNDVVGEITDTDRIESVEPRDETGFGIRSDEGELGFELEGRGRTAISNLGSKTGGEEVDPLDIAIEPADRRQSGGSDIDPQAIHNDRTPEAQIADESKDAEITTNKRKWASNPDEFDYPGVDTGPRFEQTFNDDFTDF